MITNKTEVHPTIVTVVAEVSELVKDKEYLNTLNQEVVEYFMNYLSNHYKYSDSKGKFAEYEFPRIPFYYHLDDKKLVLEGAPNRTIFIGELQTARYKRNRYIDEGIDIIRYQGLKYRVNILGQFFRPRIKELVSKWGKEAILNKKFLVNSEDVSYYEIVNGNVPLDLFVSDESRQLIFETMITTPYQKEKVGELLNHIIPIWEDKFADTWELLNFSEVITEKPIKLNQETLWNYSRYLEFGENGSSYVSKHTHTFSQTKTDFIIDVEDLPHYLFYDASKDVGKKLLKLSEFISNQVSKIIISPEKVTALTSILELMQNGVLQFNGDKDEYNSRYIFLYKLLEKVKEQS